MWPHVTAHPFVTTPCYCIRVLVASRIGGPHSFHVPCMNHEPCVDTAGAMFGQQNACVGTSHATQVDAYINAWNAWGEEYKRQHPNDNSDQKAILIAECSHCSVSILACGKTFDPYRFRLHRMAADLRWAAPGLLLRQRQIRATKQIPAFRSFPALLWTARHARVLLRRMRWCQCVICAPCST